MHSIGEIWNSRDVGVGANAGTLCSGLRRDPDVESWCGDVRRHARACVHENGNCGAFRADRAGDTSIRPPAAVEGSGDRKTAPGPHEVFWGEDRVGDALAKDATEGQLRAVGTFPRSI